MNAWDRAWHGPVLAARAWLLRRGLLALLAFDAWTLEVPHGGRYGAGGFNVAHFAWIDAVHAVPTPALYVGLMLAVGTLALVGALAGATRPLLAVVFAGWTWGWSMSLLDAYQHHYFLSILLLGVLFAPHDDTRFQRTESGAWAWRLLAVNIGIVYAFAAVTKLEPGWLDGSALRKAAWPGLRELGVPEPSWPWLARGTIAFEGLLAVAYVASAWREALPPRAGVAVTVTAVGALVFHAVIQASGFRVGWFGFYMGLCACAFLLPARWVERAVGRLPHVRIAAGRPGWALAGGLAVAAAGWWAGLPGSAVGGGLAGAVVASLAWARPVVGAAGVVAGAALIATLAASTVRFDYYRFLGGDLRRRGEYAAALDAYRAAERLAPAGRSRADDIHALEAALSRGTEPPASLDDEEEEQP